MSQSTKSENQTSNKSQEHGATGNEPLRIEDHSNCGACSMDTSNSRVNVGNKERIASAVGGVALAAYGLTRSGPTGWLLAAVGIGLLYRGSSGHCSAYEALDINTAE